uniref:RING-type E3 ubiquitin transferase n=1 Tax=Rhizophora mucronata TaxID=61149 RepID=A0A2P2KX61_RHIMU
MASQDYMLFDPFIYHGMSEMHDRHRDLRLDVDNMSYEVKQHKIIFLLINLKLIAFLLIQRWEYQELLALEERIGDVSTGLSEETILRLMKQKKYTAVTTESPSDVEPCCICQEGYTDGDDLGILDCGHDFHADCIRQWLTHKNLCPICKMTALPT